MWPYCNPTTYLASNCQLLRAGDVFKCSPLDNASKAERGPYHRGIESSRLWREHHEVYLWMTWLLFHCLHKTHICQHVPSQNNNIQSCSTYRVPIWLRIINDHIMLLVTAGKHVDTWCMLKLEVRESVAWSTGIYDITSTTRSDHHTTCTSAPPTSLCFDLYLQNKHTANRGVLCWTVMSNTFLIIDILPLSSVRSWRVIYWVMIR